MPKPRKPDAEEIEELIVYTWVNQWGNDFPMPLPNEEFDTLANLVHSAYIAVFENYMTDSPGNAGKLMVVVWPGAPEMYEAFIWRNGKIKHIKKEN